VIETPKGLAQRLNGSARPILQFIQHAKIKIDLLCSAKEAAFLSALIPVEVEQYLAKGRLGLLRLTVGFDLASVILLRLTVSGTRAAE
jgi:hypothetical protein